MVRNKYIKKIVVLLPMVAVLSGLLLAGHSTAQQSTQVGAVLCTTESPDLQITQPLSDSVTDSSTIQIEGTALYTSQIDVVLNGQYSNSVAIGFDSVLQTQISLQEGTNTITLQAYFSCNGTSAEFDIIVDYRPAVVPSNPGNIDTQVVSSVQNSDSVSQDTSSKSIVGQIVENIKEKLGFEKQHEIFDDKVDQSHVMTAFNWVLFLILLSLFGLLFAPSAIIEKLVGVFALNKQQSIKYPHKFLRFIIAFMIIFITMIFSSVL